MKLSARNQLKGTVVSIQEGAVNGIVKIDIGGGNVISSTISMTSIKELGLEVGKTAYAVIKATSVMVGVDDYVIIIKKREQTAPAFFIVYNPRLDL